MAECQTVRMAAKWYHEINGLLWLRDEFVFLAVILDAFSRRVIGWVLDRNMEDVLTLTALRMALSRRSI